jgi:predicted RNA binding protein YcfA (HicA-like mRNA interferase family)
VSQWPSCKASRVYRALLRIGWKPKGEKKPGSHVQLQREGFPDYTWGWHDSEEIGPVAMKKIGKFTGLTPEDL